MKTDDLVTVTLLCCVSLFSLALIIIGKPWIHKLGQMPLFNIRQNDKTITDTPGGIQPLLLLQTVMILGLLLMDISIRQNLPFTEVSFQPNRLLMVYILYITLFLFGCWLFYQFVCWLFLKSNERPLVMEAWVNSVCLEGVLFIPLVIIDIYYKIPFVYFLFFIGLMAFLPRYLLFYWLNKLFCLKSYGSLLLILYFCALEIVPLILVVFGTKQLNRYFF
ncbi:MAG: DUF4271 domain-containing protein [Bacteroidaceae bacterium]|nr:DUF4271 domain-containing protein [Bacteroidaceae bacterium]